MYNLSTYEYVDKLYYGYNRYVNKVIKIKYNI